MMVTTKMSAEQQLLVIHHLDLLDRMGRRRRGDLTSEEVWSETALGFCKAASRHDPAKGDFTHYAAKTARGRVLNLAAKKRPTPFASLDEEEKRYDPADPVDSSEGPRPEDREMLQRVLSELSIQDRLLLWMRIGIEMSVKDMARDAKVSTTTMNKRVQKALERATLVGRRLSRPVASR